MIFIDTWAWLAIAYEKDPHHKVATTTHRQQARNRARYVTTDHVLSETITGLFRYVPFGKARGFIDRLLAACDADDYHLVRITADHFHHAWALRQRYADKPDISFVDFTSMAVMLDLGITEVFTGDAHFQQVGLGFQLVPSPQS